MADSSKTVDYEITANPAGFIAGMNAVQAATRQTSAAVSSGFDSVQGVFSALQGRVVALAAVMAGGAFFKEAIAATNKLTAESMSLGKRLGLTGEDASALNTALGDIGSDSDTYIGAFDKFAKQLKTNEAGLQEMGLKTRDANGHLRDSKTLFQEALGVVGQYKPGLDQTTAAMTLFGKGVDDAMKLQRLNNGVIDEAKAKNEELGLTLTQEGVNSSKAYKAAMNDVGDVLLGIKNAIGQAVMPVFTRLAQWFAEIGPAAVSVFRIAINTVATAFEVVIGVAKALWEILKALVQPILNVLSAFDKLSKGDLKGATESMQNAFDGWGDAIANGFAKAGAEIKRTATDTANIWNRSTPVAAPQGGSKTMGEFKPDKGGDKKDATPSVMAYYEQALAQEKQLATERDALHGMSKEAEAAFWADILATAKMSAGDQVAVGRKLAAAQIDVLKQQAQEANELGKVSLGAWEQRELAKVDAAQQTAQQSADAHQTTQDQLLQQEVAFEERRRQIKLSALEANRAALDPARDPVAIAQIDAQIEQLEAAHLQRVGQLRGQITKQQAAEADALGQTALAAWQARQLAKIDYEQTAAQNEMALGETTKASLLQQELAFEDRRLQIRTAAIQAQLALADRNRDPVQAAALNAQLEQLEQQHQQRLLQIRGQINQQSALELNAIWQDLSSRTSRLWDSGIQAMMNGTLTWRNAMRAVGTEMVGWFAGIVKKQVTTWIFGEEAKTGATAVGTAQRWIMESWAAAKSVALWAATAVKNIMVSAWEAMAAAWKAVAGIPYVGPVLAVAAAGAAFAGVSAIAKNVASAEGGFDIPAGTNPMTQLHEREMVLPAKHADVIRSLAERGPGGMGGGGGGEVHVNVRGASVGDFLLLHKAELVKALQAANRDNLVRVR